ncbi:MAG: hypothetical protein NW216_02880 [Hyphomicrobium sp.]|nr:hypothetical protein [Hyphomicrobium sp.]
MKAKSNSSPALDRRRSSRGARSVIHARAEIIVGSSFRHWLAGYQTGDVRHWQRAFTFAVDMLGTERAQIVCTDFSRWVRLLGERSRRDLEVLAPNAPRYGRDECVAMALIASYQHQACPALQACAMTLLGCEPSAELVDRSSKVAERLTGFDEILPAHALHEVVRQAEPSVHLLA